MGTTEYRSEENCKWMLWQTGEKNFSLLHRLEVFFPCNCFNCAIRPEERRDKTKEFIIHFWVLKPIPLSLWAKYKFWFIKIDLLYLRKVEYHVTIEYKMHG